MMENNVSFSKAYCVSRSSKKIPAGVRLERSDLRSESKFPRSSENEAPLNLYGQSKLIFDNYVRSILPLFPSPVAACATSTCMALGKLQRTHGSMIYQLYCQLRRDGRARFSRQRRFCRGRTAAIFVSVSDVIGVNLFFAGGPAGKGSSTSGPARPGRSTKW